MRKKFKLWNPACGPDMVARRGHRLFSAFLLAAALTVPATSMAQTERVTVRGGSVTQVLKDIEKQTHYTFVYRNNLLNSSTRTSVKGQGRPLKEVLNEMLAPLGLTYSLTNRTISITRVPPREQTDSKTNQQKHKPETQPATGIVRGKVVDANGDPVIGATVRQGKNAAATDIDGNFSIKANSSQPIEVSCVGMKRKNVKVTGTAPLRVTMEDDVTLLDEVVAIGYGSAQRRDITSAIGSYKPGQDNTRDVLGVDQMLQGQVAGVNITGASGTPGSRSRVSIRGIGSITAGNEPLYVIDGVPINNTSGDTGNWGSESMSGLADFNPSDIESVQVLKDASSAAIYGSRATNGVILITTKKGTEGKARITIDTNLSFSNMTNKDKVEMADADLFLEVLNEGIDNYNIQTGGTVARIDNPAPGKAQTDWLDLVTRTATTFNITGAVAGGSKTTDYYVSLNYRRNEGVIIDNLLKKYGFKTTLNSQIRPWLKIGTNVNLSYSRNNRVPAGYNIGTSVIVRALEQRPWDEPYLPNGNWAVGGQELANHNPIQAIKEEDVYIDNYRMLGNFYMQFFIAPGLTLKTTLAEDFNTKEEHIYYTDKHNYGKNQGLLTDGRRNYSSTLWENVMNYSGDFFNKDLKLDAMLGYTIQKDVSSSAAQTGMGFPSPSFDVNSVAAEFTNVSTGKSSFLMQSYLGRVTLNYKNRYLLTGSLRADGSSKFRAGNRYGWFPSVSAGWNISEEPWWRAAGMNAKIRASYGSTGNQGGIGAYAYMGLATGGYNYNGANGLGISSAGNPDLHWEKSNQGDIGIDLSFFNNKFTFTADAFIKDTKDLLYSKPTAATTGFTSYTCNIGSMRNKGIEFTIGGNARAGQFSWHGDFNISFIKNKLTGLLDPNDILTTDSMHALKVGEPLGSFYMIKWLGIYQHDEDVPETLYAEGVRAGDCIYEDYNNDGKIDAGDRQFVGSANPKFTGGLNNTFKYRGFDLSVFFTFSYGAKIYELCTGFLRMGNGTWPMMKSHAEQRWTGPGTTNEAPRAIYGYTWNSTKFVNTRNLHDASYFRCRSLTFGYTFPKSLMQKVRVDNLRLYFQADNLFCATKWPYLDPEVNVSLNATNMGYDYLYPGQPRTFTVGANIRF